MRLIGVLVVSFLLAAPAAGAATLAGAQVGFSADRLLILDGHRYVGKIWATPGKERHEQRILGFDPVFLLRADSPVAEIVLAQMKTVVDFLLPPELRLLRLPALRRRAIGHATVDGIATTEYAIDERVPQGHAMGRLWLGRGGIPMKLAGTFTGRKGRVARIRWELHDVRIGPQPAALFEAPRGFTKLPAAAVAPLLGLRLKPATR